MTREVGAITGEPEVVTLPRGQRVVEVVVRYAEADEWYVVEGSPIESSRIGGTSGLCELHERIIEHLTTPGPLIECNEEPVSLRGFCF